MRLDVTKVLFVGSETVRKSFFAKMQELGVTEFLVNTPREPSKEVETYLEALRILRSQPVCAQQSGPWSKNPAEHICQLQSKKQSLEEKIRLLQLEIARVAGFGDFDLSSFDAIKTLDLQVAFFTAKKPIDYPQLSLVHVEGSFHYYIYIGKEPPSIDGLFPVQLTQTISQLKAELYKDQIQLAAICSELSDLAKWIDKLHEALEVAVDRQDLEHTSSSVSELISPAVFYVESWVLNRNLTEVFDLARQNGILAEEIATSPEDRIPTALQNVGLARAGEDLVGIYDTPGITDVDPSAWVLWSFACFFAVIVGDGGYGLVFLAAYFYFKKDAKKAFEKRLVKLGGLLAVFCVSWGLMTSSFFGMSLDLHNPLRNVSGVFYLVQAKASYHLARQDDTFMRYKAQFPALDSNMSGKQALATCARQDFEGNVTYSMLDAFTQSVMLELALFIGCVHLALGMIRSLGKSLGGLGWIAFMAGGYLWCPSMLGKATSLVHVLTGLDPAVGYAVGKNMLLSGLGFAVLVGVFKAGAGGLMELMTAIQVFSDVLSYLRLYALGLAGGLMAATFNDLAASAGSVFGIVVLILGHTINIVLAIMGGVIHGLRLIFLEWYHYGFDGGGKWFKPLKLTAKE